ncbi:hypothetical protein PENTCL1PPCAC_27018 [Pristionchus entomophagus]|uniref:Uncharacterized protein n=1 Tax=Pristionchus entomophagus TaxID=358040 RepID=A0AAV5UEL1_9BILA|nr:hypothetical protein PENTCL1PPCAC_27018 [Pristionchus entomophagus]
MEARANLESTRRAKEAELKKRKNEEKEREDEKEREKRRKKEEKEIIVRTKEEEKMKIMEEKNKKEEEENRKREEHREPRAYSDESGIHIMMPDIDSDMNGEGDDEVQYIETIDLEMNTHMNGDEDGPSTSSLPDPSMPSTSNLIFYPSCR